jgi:phosphatidylglycerol:prolipoprotein diacylglycerol transferase
MLQTLFHIPLNWLWGLWAVSSCVWLGWLARREGFKSAARAILPVIVTFALIIGLIVPALCDRDGLPIRGYGVMLLAGLLSGVLLAAYRAQQMGQSPEMIQSLAAWLVVAGILGARGFYVVEYWHEYQRPGLWETVKAIADFTKGGLVVFGSAIGAGLALMLFVRKYRLPGLALADLIAPSLMLGLAFGRIGCFMNGCCYGNQCDAPWAVRFPSGSPPHLEEVQKGQLTLFGLTIVNQDVRAPAVINQVEPGSMADRAGLRAGQRITRIRVNDYEFPGPPREPRLSCAAQKEKNGPARRAEPTTVEDAQLALATAQHVGDQIAIFTTDSTVPETWTVTGPPSKSLPLHPVQLYAAVDALLLCLLLLAYYPYRRRDGEVFALMITIHPVSRFLQEWIRSDEPPVWGTGLHISANISILMLAGAIGLWIYLSGRDKGTIWPATCPP